MNQLVNCKQKLKPSTFLRYLLTRFHAFMDKNLSELLNSSISSSSSQNTSSTNSNREIRRNVVVGICITGSALIASLLWPFIAPGLKKVALPFLPATDRQVALVRSVLAGKHGKMIDLGSGDGRLVIVAAKEGLEATGVELNSWLVLWSRYQSFASGLSGRAKFIRQDLYKSNFGDYDHVVLFGVSGMMQSIKQKLAIEMKDDGTFIACRFPLPNSKATNILGSGGDTVWIYRKTDIVTETG